MEIRPDGHARTKIQAQSTKKRYFRYPFFTKEAVDWLKTYRLTLLNGNDNNGDSWLFPGELGDHLDESTAWGAMKKLFRISGPNDTEDETWTEHSFRTLADSRMSKGGMDRKFIAATIGHRSKLAAEISYMDWEEAESQFMEAQDFLTVNRQTAELIVSEKQIEKLRNAFLQALKRGLPVKDADAVRKLLE